MQHCKISAGKFDYDLRTKHEDTIRGEADREYGENVTAAQTQQITPLITSPQPIVW